MKLIGYTADRTGWYPEPPSRTMDIFKEVYVAELRENVNAEKWEHIGWIYPAEQLNNTPPFTIAAGEKPSTNAVAAFIMRQIETPGPNSPVKRSEFDNMVKEAKSEFAALRASLDELAAFAEQVDKTLELFAKQLANRRELDNVPPADAMTFYDHAFIAAWFNIQASGFSNNADACIRHAHGMAATLTAARRKPATGA